MVSDPTIGLPLPSIVDPQWTVLRENGRSGFDGSAFGDGSGVTPFGPESTRCGFGVVQVQRLHGTYVVRACLMGPLPLPLQATPAAEAFALLQYALHLELSAGLLSFFTDCQWVVDSFNAGRRATTHAFARHADIWRRIWDTYDDRGLNFRVVKVKAHATDSHVLQGYPEWWKEGNAYADAAAKAGRAMHPRNEPLETSALAVFDLISIVCRVVAAGHLSALQEGSDVPPCPQRHRRERTQIAINRRPAADERHVIIKDAGRWRCTWCLRSSTVYAKVASEKCTASQSHVLWKADDFIICSCCGSYSKQRAVLLSRPCRGKRGPYGDSIHRRVFGQRLRPRHLDCARASLDVHELTRLTGPDPFILAGGFYADGTLDTSNLPNDVVGELDEDNQDGHSSSSSLNSHFSAAEIADLAMRLCDPSRDGITRRAYDASRADGQRYSIAVCPKRPAQPVLLHQNGETASRRSRFRFPSDTTSSLASAISDTLLAAPIRRIRYRTKSRPV